MDRLKAAGYVPQDDELSFATKGGKYPVQRVHHPTTPMALYSAAFTRGKRERCSNSKIDAVLRI
jgi:hypothetical protein